MKKGDKKAQFYLIAAMIIIIIITMFAVIFNFSEKKSSTKISELGEELNIEGGRVLDYDTFNGENQMENFTKEFSAYAGSDIKIYYILGEAGDINEYRYTGGEKIEGDLEEVDGEILVTFDGLDYKFDVMAGMNFYYVISQNIDGETHVFAN